MNENPAPRGRIWKALAVAAIVAAVVLITVVLPAEYGIDPTRIGRALGLTTMNQPADDAEPPLDAVIDDLLADSENLQAASDADPRDPLPLPNPAISQIEAAPAKTQTITIRLGFDEKTEVKAVLGKAKAIVYDWKVEGGEVYVDFHGHDPAKGDHYWVRYEEADGIKGRSGSLVSPFAGEHGWFWLNVSEEPITITLTVTGYFDKLVDYGLL